MAQIKLKTNKVFRHLEESTAKIVVQQGGTRSGKTFNILLWIIFAYCQRNEGKIITICRKSFPALRGTVMRDFFQILKDHDIYSEDYHSKSNNEYRINENTIEFISLDMPQKIRGRKRDLLFANEANELTQEDWTQLLFRTNEKVILDYNPSEEFHWIYDQVLPRADVDFFQTTYKDNPFLGDVIKEEIERLRGIDENYWRVYGLGERGQARSLVYTFSTTKEIPKEAKLISYGLDFGYSSDPTSLVRTYILEDNMYVDELLYRTGMTNQDIANEMKVLGLDRSNEIYADSAEPKSIEEIYRMGWNVKPTIKGSINIGIDIIRRYKLIATESSFNLIKELRNYKYIEDKNGQMTNKPVDNFNHALDALRYSVVNKISKSHLGRYSFR
jgi:phage terminase large subunit